MVGKAGFAMMPALLRLGLSILQKYHMTCSPHASWQVPLDTIGQQEIWRLKQQHKQTIKKTNLEGCNVKEKQGQCAKS
jgi:hypothetical protein